MTRFAISALFCLTALGLAGAALGQTAKPGIVGEDDRVPFEADGVPWDAVGQINIAGYRTVSRCTGTLIAPSLVVTAAHCVVDPWRKAAYPLHAVHFLAGVRRSRHKAHGTAKCLHFLDGPASSRRAGGSASKPGKVTRDDLLSDVAVIVLNEQLMIAPAPLAEPDSETGRLLHAAYAADRRSLLSVHKDCRRLKSALGDGLWLTDCDTHEASSGGPIFTTTDGALTLAAIMLATGGGRANVALPLSEWRQLTSKTDCP